MNNSNITPLKILDENMPIWDVFGENGKWLMAVTSPIGWDAHSVMSALKLSGYAVTQVIARHYVSEETVPKDFLIADKERFDADLKKASDEWYSLVSNNFESEADFQLIVRDFYLKNAFALVIRDMHKIDVPDNMTDILPNEILTQYRYYTFTMQVLIREFVSHPEIPLNTPDVATMERHLLKYFQKLWLKDNYKPI